MGLKTFYCAQDLVFKFQSNTQYKKTLLPNWKKGGKFLNILFTIAVQLTTPVVLNSNPLSVSQLNLYPTQDDMTMRQAVAY